MNRYAQEVFDEIKRSSHDQPEFIQAVAEVFSSISIVLDKEPVLKKERILERLVEPERIIIFRVPWRDDRGEIHVNRGYRVESNSALGPYKGGLRFHASVNLSKLKFLGFEQIFKNSLTGLPLGGGKGGSDFSANDKSANEVMNFCQSFMTELSRHIGANTDVPAGDIGVGGREIGFLFGQYKRIKNIFEGVLTGKGLSWGGSLIRPEATGFGISYSTEEMLKTKKQSLDGKVVAISGFGNVAWGTVQKVTALGGTVVTLSGPDGFIHDPDGIKGEKIDYMLEMRGSGHDSVADYAKKFGVSFYQGKRPWNIKCDVAIPCACENELDEIDAKDLIKNGCVCVVEGANMPATHTAVELLTKNGVLFAPGKAANAGGVACSGLEMAQNSIRLNWTSEEVDQRLHQIMVRIHNNCLEASQKYGTPGNYINGANIAGFQKVAYAMMEQGLI